MIGARYTAGALSAFSLVLAAAPAFAQSDEPHEFTIDGATFAVPVPEGFCLPSAAQVPLADQVAALDKMNATHATFDRCGSFGVDYIHIKSPRESERIAVPKPVFVALVARQIQSTAGQQLMDEALDQAGREIATDTDNAVALSAPVPRYAGQDLDCAYLSIAADVVLGDKTVAMNSVTCLTLVGEQFVSVHSYARQDAGVTEAQLKERSHAIAVAIKPKA